MPNRDAQTHKQPTPAKPPKQGEPHLKTDKAGDKKKWDLIDEHAWESFPASDPPASWAGRDISPEEREQTAQAESSPAPAPSEMAAPERKKKDTSTKNQR